MTDHLHALLPLPDANAVTPQQRSRVLRNFRLGVLVLLGLLLLAAAAAVVLRVVQAHALEDATAHQNQLYVVTVQAKSNTADHPVRLPGTLQGSLEAPIYARSAGYVTRWTHDIGTRVKKGAVLAEIATPEIDQQLAQALAARPQIQSTVALATSSFGRWQNLRRQDAVSQQELDERQSTLTQAQANLASADANVRRLRELQSFQRVLAPFAGTITRRNINVGDLIDAGNGGVAKALFTLAQTDTLKVSVYVPQTYAQQVRVGQPVTLTQAELAGQVFQGSVARTAGAIDPVTRTLQIDIILANADARLLAGSFVSVALPGLASRALTVPTNCLLLRAEGPRIAVVGTDRRVKLHAVTLGADFGQTIEVLGGIAVTDRLVLNPPDSLADGDLVVVAPVAKKPVA